MVEITLLQVNFGDGLTADLPFGQVKSGDSDDEDDVGTVDDSSSGGKKGKLLVATFVLLILAGGAAAAKYLMGDGSPDVAVETPDSPVGVPLGDDE